ncbi:hypothetical protein [Streptomyces goshikiensis]|uniref:hypothetical protein n=1 Tax=Streptomyces goshikiensis TaxID=1942 RepID=UPI0037B10C30
MARILPSPTAVLGFRRDGRPIFPVLGASSEDPSNSPDTQVTFGQQQLQHLMAREKDQGARAGARALVDRLGFASAAELEQFVTSQREAEKQQLTEVQRREQELTAREAAAGQREAQAIAREREAVRRSALAGLGATGTGLEDAVVLLRAPGDADDVALAQAAQDLRQRRPELFGPASPGPAPVPPAPGGAPASVPPPRPGGQTSKPGAAGLAMARRRGLVPPTS